MAAEPLTCPVCGTPVRVVGTDEGTQHYAPLRSDVLDVAALADALNEWWFDPNEPTEVQERKAGGIDAETAADFIAQAYRDYFDAVRLRATTEAPDGR